MKRPPQRGRPSKGKRQAIFLRVPASVKTALVEAAERRRMTLTDLAVECLTTCLAAEAHDA